MKFNFLRLFAIINILFNLIFISVHTKSRNTSKNNKYNKQYQNESDLGSSNNSIKYNDKSNEIETYNTNTDTNLNNKLYCIWSDFSLFKVNEKSISWKLNTEEDDENNDSLNNNKKNNIENYTFEVKLTSNMLIIKNSEGLIVKKIEFKDVLLKNEEVGFETGVLKSSFGLNCLTFSYLNTSNKNYYSKFSKIGNIKFINICPFQISGKDITHVTPNSNQIKYLRQLIMTGRKRFEEKIFEYYDYGASKDQFEKFKNRKSLNKYKYAKDPSSSSHDKESSINISNNDNDNSSLVKKVDNLTKIVEKIMKSKQNINSNNSESNGSNCSDDNNKDNNDKLINSSTSNSDFKSNNLSKKNKKEEKKSGKSLFESSTHSKLVNSFSNFMGSSDKYRFKSLNKNKIKAKSKIKTKTKSKKSKKYNQFLDNLAISLPPINGLPIAVKFSSPPKYIECLLREGYLNLIKPNTLTQIVHPSSPAYNSLVSAGSLVTPVKVILTPDMFKLKINDYLDLSSFLLTEIKAVQSDDFNFKCFKIFLGQGVIVTLCDIEGVSCNSSTQINLNALNCADDWIKSILKFKTECSGFSSFINPNTFSQTKSLGMESPISSNANDKVNNFLSKADEFLNTIKQINSNNLNKKVSHRNRPALNTKKSKNGIEIDVERSTEDYKSRNKNKKKNKYNFLLEDNDDKLEKSINISNNNESNSNSEIKNTNGEEFVGKLKGTVNTNFKPSKINVVDKSLDQQIAVLLENEDSKIKSMKKDLKLILESEKAKSNTNIANKKTRKNEIDQNSAVGRLGDNKDDSENYEELNSSIQGRRKLRNKNDENLRINSDVVGRIGDNKDNSEDYEELNNNIQSQRKYRANNEGELNNGNGNGNNSPIGKLGDNKDDDENYEKLNERIKPLKRKIRTDNKSGANDSNNNNTGLLGDNKDDDENYENLNNKIKPLNKKRVDDNSDSKDSNEKIVGRLGDNKDSTTDYEELNNSIKPINKRKRIDDSNKSDFLGRLGDNKDLEEDYEKLNEELQEKLIKKRLRQESDETNNSDENNEYKSHNKKKDIRKNHLNKNRNRNHLSNYGSFNNNNNNNHFNSGIRGFNNQPNNFNNNNNYNFNNNSNNNRNNNSNNMNYQNQNFINNNNNNNSNNNNLNQNQLQNTNNDSNNQSQMQQNNDNSQQMQSQQTNDQQQMQQNNPQAQGAAGNSMSNTPPSNSKDLNICFTKEYENMLNYYKFNIVLPELKKTTLSSDSFCNLCCDNELHLEKPQSKRCCKQKCDIESLRTVSTTYDCVDFLSELKRDNNLIKVEHPLSVTRRRGDMINFDNGSNDIPQTLNPSPLDINAKKENFLFPGYPTV